MSVNSEASENSQVFIKLKNLQKCVLENHKQSENGRLYFHIYFFVDNGHDESRDIWIAKFSI